MTTSKKLKLYQLFSALAYGDAYSVPTEMMTPQQIDFNFPSGISQLSKISKNTLPTKYTTAGQTTDDTEHTLLVAKNIIDNHGIFNRNAYLTTLHTHAIVQAHKNKPTKTSTNLTFNKNQMNLLSQNTGCFSTTNETAMTCSSLSALVNWTDKHELINCVEKFSLPTHNTNVAIMGASMIVATISHGLTRIKFTVEDALETALSYAHRSLYTKTGIQIPMPSMYQKCIMALEFCESAQAIQDPKTASRNVYDYCGCGYETIETIPAVLAVVKLACGKVSKAAKIATEMGGDTDAIASIACAICSQINYDLLPEEVKLIEQVNNYNFEKLAIDLENETSLPYDVAI